MIVSGSQSVRAQGLIRMEGTIRKVMLGATTREGTPRGGTPRGGIPREGTPRGGTPREGTPRGGTNRVGTNREGIIRMGTAREVTLKVITTAPILTIKEMEETLPGRAKEPVLAGKATGTIIRMEPLLTGTITLVMLTTKRMDPTPIGKMKAPSRTGRPTGTTSPIQMAALMGEKTGATPQSSLLMSRDPPSPLMDRSPPTATAYLNRMETRTSLVRVRKQPSLIKLIIRLMRAVTMATMVSKPMKSIKLPLPRLLALPNQALSRPEKEK